MPSQFLDACVEILLHKVSALVLVVVQHNALQQSLGELQLTNLLLHVGTHVEQELIVTVGLELLTDLISNLLAELFLVLYSALTEGLVKQSLVNLSLLEAADLGNLIGKVTLVVLDFLLLNLQQARNLYIALRISLAGIPSDDVAQFGTLEEFLLVVHLHILRHQHSISHLDTTFFHIAVSVQLTKVALQHIALFRIEILYLLILSCTALIHLYLLVNEFIVNSDVIERNLVLTAQFGLELRSHSNIKLKLQGLVTLEIKLLLLVTGKWLTQHVNLVILYISIQFLAQHTVNHVNLDVCTELTLDHPHRSLTRTESGNLCTLAIVFQSFLNLGLIVSSLQGNRHQTIHLIRSFKLNIHLSYTLFNNIYDFCKLAAKVQRKVKNEE